MSDPHKARAGRAVGKAPTSKGSAKSIPDPTTPVGPPRLSSPFTIESATPRSIRLQAGHGKLTTLRPKIAQYMIKETLYCTRDDFFEHYFVSPPDAKNLGKVFEHMSDKRILIPRPKSLSNVEDPKLKDPLPPSDVPVNQPTTSEQTYPERPYPQVLKYFTQKPSKGKKSLKIGEKDAFAPLEKLGKEIRNCMEEAGLPVNEFELQMVPDNHLASDVEGCNSRVDACIRRIATVPKKSTRGSKPSKRIHVSEMVMAFEFKLHRNDKENSENRLQLASTVTQLMNDDVSRDFAYGMTIEDDRVSLWYFSRGHTVKAISFSLIERPDLLIRTFVSIFSATREELGYNPRITRLGPGGSYLYELDELDPPEGNEPSDDSDPSKAKLDPSQPEASIGNPNRSKTRFFKTTQIVSEIRGYRIAGRNTRIWKAVEVMSKNDLTTKGDGREIILKDAWIDSEAANEFDIQQQLFRDIDRLKKSDWESLGILEEIEKSPSKEEIQQMDNYLKDDSYKDLFLRFDENVRYISDSSKSAHPRAWNPPPNVFSLALEQAEDLDPSGESMRTGDMNSSSQMVTRAEAPNHPVTSNPLCLAPKKRCFFAFPETCTRVSRLPTLGDAMDVLHQAYYALLLMFCAGWVHRDISDRNILSIKVDGKWLVKLADLEYAKKLPRTVQGSPGPKTGTPYFMACEIQSSELLCPLSRQMFQKKVPNWLKKGKDAEPDTAPATKAAVMHIVLHDIESLWWLILWIITSRVGCEASKAAMRNIFKVDNNF